MVGAQDVEEEVAVQGIVRDLGIGAAAGYGAGMVMDRATTWFYGRQSEASKRREDEVLPGGAPMASGRRVAGLLGLEATDDRAAKLAQLMHQSLGITYGMAAATLVRGGMRPLRAGLATGVAGFLLVDELANSLLFTPPPQAYPVESHLRGVVGHLTFGAATGFLLALARRAGGLRAWETTRSG
jgi:hypothetical protein